MQKIKIYLFAACSLCLLLTQRLSAQTEEQQISTDIISQFFANEFVFNASATRSISKEEMLEFIEANEMILPDVRENLNEELRLNVPTHRWKSIYAEIPDDCDQIATFLILYEDEENSGGQLTVLVPPNNNCFKVISPLLEFIYGGYISGKGEIKRCTSNVCVTIPDYLPTEERGCLEIVALVDASSECVFSYNCSTDDECGDADREFMLTLLFIE